MILQFSVSNYRCFRQVQTLNFAASSQDKSLPDNCFGVELPGLSGKRWVKGTALYGANASGKTTVLKAINALLKMVAMSAYTIDPKEPIKQIEPFALDPKQAETPTAFRVVFVSDDMRYEYRVAATRERIWHESLRAFPKKVEQLWFSRDWKPDSGEYEWSPERPSGFLRDLQLERYTLSNMLFLSKAVASNRDDLEPVFRWFKERVQFLDISHRNVFDEFSIRQIQGRTAISGRIVELLRQADLGVIGARVVERRPTSELEKLIDKSLGKEDLGQPELIHRGAENKEWALPWQTESKGTQHFFALAGPWLDYLSKGYTVLIDELETSIHPLMARELLRLFFSASENPRGAQVVFTTHNPLLLDTSLLRRDQVWFTGKDKSGAAHLYPLTDYGPRKGESLWRGYLSGRYGAVPFMPDGLLGTFPQSAERSADSDDEAISG